MEARMWNKIASKIERKEKKYIEALRELVKTKSLSGKEGRVGEYGIANLIWQRLNEIGVEPSFQEVKKSHNVIYEVGEGDKCIVLSAHMDTVSSGDESKWFVNPFSAANGVVRYLGNSTVELEVDKKKYKGKIRNQMDKIWKIRKTAERNVIYGRGSYDNKASVVILLYLIDILKDLKLNGKLYAVFTVREEIDGAGIKKFIEKHRNDFQNFKKRYAIVLEGSYSFMPVIAHRGVCWAYIRTFGKRSHASTPHLGKNAIVEMCNIIKHIEDKKREIVEELNTYSKDELLGEPIFSITSIVGGGIRRVERGKIDRKDINVIPDFCEVSVDIRFGRGITAKVLQEVFSNRIQEVSKNFRFILGDDTYYPAAGIGNSFEEAVNNELVRAAIESSGVNHLDIAPGATEGAFLHAAGFETLVEFGPAGAFSHEYHEYVEVDEIKRGVNVLISLLNKIGFLSILK